ncbi:hypothetical protein [Deinococcus yavapaiensis]|uniref:Protein kinase-like protein n=1 Tax=Deinococcus yavapaiensis KR-236 TaxID=694435 RepID=A0A318S5L4_9DEIO|nr:hypothetical protein [Deinococcus yavapaiensis]PYE54072.1 protein kinase-like protein [Deinococcus yavapaiensis KR-236]
MKRTVKVKDEAGREYVLARELGAGGQGRVFAAQDGRHAVKVLTLPSAQEAERWAFRLNDVRRLPLEALNVTRPVALLARPHVGYVMPLVHGATPLADLAHAPRDVPSPLQWYIDTGGLKRRLSVLARTARVLSQLHAKGIVYGDPSPSNVLFVEDVGVQLIDVDNLSYEGRAGERRILTPRFAAPELYLERGGVNTLTDAFAFAAMAFQTLTLTHPLLGDAVNAGSPDEEEAALRGEWPWVDDPEDARNRASTGLAREAVLTPRLRRLCQEAFGVGLRNATRRPGVASWEDALREALGALTQCPQCAGHHAFSLDVCPWCDTPRPAVALAHTHVVDPASQRLADRFSLPVPSRVLSTTVLHRDAWVPITTRHLTGAPVDEPHLEVQFDGARLSVRSANGETYVLRHRERGEEAQVAARGKRVPLKGGRSAWELHLGALEGMHRALSFEVLEATHASQ